MIRVCLFVFITAIAGCSSEKQKLEISQDSNVVAVVGGINVTSADLHTASLRSLKKDYDELSVELQSRLLESVISTMAMARIAETQAQPAEQVLIENSVAAYRAELWVKEYLKVNAVPQPVSNSQIEEYYATHPEYFGGGDVVEYTHVRCRYSESTKVKDCTKLLADNDLSSWSEMAKNNSDITVVTASLNTLVEKSELYQVILATAEQEFSGFKNTASELHRIFVIKKRRLTPKPLVTVQREIRERLAPLQLKKAIKEVSERARANIEIVRIK
jgi:hypothetical protein